MGATAVPAMANLIPDRRRGQTARRPGGHRTIRQFEQI
ncbi:hypothetical protein I551_4325 [Mycobacterium ulcerans str. Harvey]|uniref:Uncharacterized protein n=1 Tax=Mycobacterium ulcerans str. Harvey TaxID=1299332 RepID=A0ABP3AHG0_MYCUL|nr:hypothetical protein I551_4325 [Mycobacterium ulcerans str. Harvey]